MSEEKSELEKEINLISKRYHYKTSLIKHWIEDFGKVKTEEFLQFSKSPYSSLWVQVNTSKIDIDSLFDIFEELEFDVIKNPLFDDILEVKVNQFDLSDYNKNYPVIKVDRESAQSIAMGREVFSYGVTGYEFLEKGENVEIRDAANNLIAIGKSEVSSKEIPSLKLNIVAKVIKSWGFEPPITELSYYRKGFYNILTPTQIFGVKSMYFENNDNILVLSVDKGDTALYIAERTNHKIPITVVAQNRNHLRAIQRQIRRVKTKAIRVISAPFLSFIQDVHTIKYTSVYLELQNSRTAVLPTFSSNLNFPTLRKMVSKQKKVTDLLYKCLVPNASISLITHSIDTLENELLFNHIKSKSYHEPQAFPPEIRELQKNGKIGYRDYLDERIIDDSFAHKSSTAFIDPIDIKNTGGYLMKYKFALKKKYI